MSDDNDNRTQRLSKSRFVVGRHCHKRLWWQTHEPDAPELAVDASTQFTFDQGNEVGELARTWFTDGELIDFPYYAVDEKVSAARGPKPSRSTTSGSSAVASKKWPRRFPNSQTH